LVSSSNRRAGDVGRTDSPHRRADKEDVMQNPIRSNQQPDGFAVFAGNPAALDLSRMAWEALLDLGLTDEEIAAYFRIDMADPTVFRVSVKGTALRGEISRH
jgi:hypothetical protein